MTIAKTYEIAGIVQGVGFRPFVYSLAKKYNLKGFVYNSSKGVSIHVEGESKDIFLFEKNLKKIPPLAKIDTLDIKDTNIQDFKSFEIKKSKLLNAKTTFISPDISICEDCLREFHDKTDRRYKYELINCTNCGPRYSIIKTVPYDRINTSMQKFSMCKECEDEYNNPENRRFHAEPISCPKCGPKVYYKDLNSELQSEKDVFKKLSQDIKKGEIVALKGMGGFHIICDATNEKTLNVLREKKRRAVKPFAVMFKNIEEIEKYCILNKKEKEFILSKERPIVIVKKRKKRNLPNIIAPNIDRLGVFLPYTPLHIKLFEYLKTPIVATSANLSGEPIITTFDELKNKLGFMLKSAIDHERDIVNFSDDSVLQIVDNNPVFIRLSRGYMPKTYKTNFSTKEKILSVGTQQKNTISIYQNSHITTSLYNGDLFSVESIKSYEKSIETFKNFYDFKPTFLVCDKHPRYVPTIWAKKQNLPRVEVLHHLAHVMSVMFENNINEEVLGISWDGTGFGNDGTIWGGEFFLCDYKNHKRVLSFKPFKLLGGEKSVKNINRVLFSILHEDINNKYVKKYIKENFSESEFLLLKESYEKDINAYKCSSVGRIFDATCSLALNKKSVSYDGESGLNLEMLYDKKIKSSYDYCIKDNKIEYFHWFCEMLEEKPKEIASKFINTLVKIIIDAAKTYQKKVVFCGGVFQNKTLLNECIKAFKKEKIEYFMPKEHSVNDSSVSLGGLIYTLHNQNELE